MASLQSPSSLRLSWGPPLCGAGRWRLGCAATASLLLHAAGLWWLVLPASAVRAPLLPPREAMQVLWIMAPPAAAAGPAREALTGHSPVAPVLPAEESGQGRAVSPVPLPANAASPAPPALGMPTDKEWQDAYSGRVTRVESEAGVYCVRLPPANRLPQVGAAPRIATVTNC